MMARLIPVGGSLAALGTPAAVGNVMTPKEFYDDTGTKRIGTMPVGDAIASEIKFGKKAIVNSAEVTGTRYMWLEDYGKSLASMFQNVALPASVVLTAPNVLLCGTAFGSATGMTSLTLTVSANATSMTYMCNGSTALQTLTLGASTSKVTNFSGFCDGATGLVTITNALSLDAATNVPDMFKNCAALVNVLFVAGTIEISISFAQSPNLSAVSLVSIGNGLLEDAAAKTITFHATAKTACDALMGDVSGADGAYVFTANPAGATSLTTFMTTNKGWTVA